PRSGGALLPASRPGAAAAPPAPCGFDGQLRRPGSGAPVAEPGTAHLDPRLIAPCYGFPRMVTICTVLPAPDRPRVDAAGDGCFTTLHAGSFRDAVHAARRRRVDALVPSLHRCQRDHAPRVPPSVRCV